MLDLGKYAGAVLSSYAVALGLLALLVWLSWQRYRKVKAELAALEADRQSRG